MGGGGWHVPAGGYLARLRARRQVLEAVENNLRERGLDVPPRLMPPEAKIALSFFCLIVAALMVGVLFRLQRSA